MNSRTRFLLFFVFVSLLSAGLFRPVSAATLNSIEQYAGPAAGRLELLFSAPVSFRLDGGGDRFELLLMATRSGQGLQLPAAGQFLTGAQAEQKNRDLLLSLTFPHPVRLSTSFSFPASSTAGGNRLILNIVPLSAPASAEETAEPAAPPPASAPAPEIAATGGTNDREEEKLPAFLKSARQPVPRIEAGPAQPPARPMIAMELAASARTVGSPYAADWKSFFEKFEQDFAPAIPLGYTRPPYPLLELAAPQGDQDFLDELRSLGQAGHWKKAIDTLQRESTAAEPRLAKAELLLLFGDSLLRDNAFEGATKVLEELLKLDNAPALAEAGRYLLALNRAMAGDPYGAELASAKLLAELTPGSPLQPYLHLLEAEALLASDQAARALELLSADLEPLPEGLEEKRMLRLADALFGTDRQARALALYSQLGEGEELQTLDPYSLAKYVKGLRQFGRHQEALEACRTLDAILVGQPAQELVRHQSALLLLKIGREEEAVKQLNTILDTTASDEARHRALMKMSDLIVLRDPANVPPVAIGHYGEIARKSSLRELREEAAFKEALVFHLRGEEVRSVRLLDNFFRAYGAGPLRPHADALMLAILPDVIKKLINEEEYLQALVLAEQNRDLFISGRVSGDFLAELGLAFSSLLFWNRAVRVYLYMLDLSRGTKNEEKVYEPLIRAMLEQGDLQGTILHGRQYLDKFPSGPSRAQVYGYLAQALQRNGAGDEAVALLKSPTRPAGGELDLLAGRIFFERQDYDAAAAVLAKAGKQPAAEAETVFLLAESLYHLGRLQEALPLFGDLARREPATPVAPQAAYRQGQILLASGRSEEALKILGELAEKTEDPLWSKMAAETIALQGL